MKLSAGKVQTAEFPSIFKVVITTGNSEVFKNAVLDRLYASEKYIKYDVGNFREDIDKLYYKPILAKYWWVKINADRLTTPQQKRIAEYIKNPSEHALMIINSMDYRYRRSLMKNRTVARSDSCAWIDFEYPGYSFLTQYVEGELKGKTIERRAAHLFIKYISDNYDEYPTYLELLNSLPTNEITVRDVKDTVDDLSQYRTDTLLNTLVNLDRVTIPFKALKDILDEFSPTYVLAGIKSYFRYLYEAKIYLKRGLLISDGNIERDKAYILKNKLQLPDSGKRKSLIKLPHKYINNYLRAASRITMKEILYCLHIISAYRYADEEQIYKIVLLILNRRNEENINEVIKL